MNLSLIALTANLGIRTRQQAYAQMASSMSAAPSNPAAVAPAFACHACARNSQPASSGNIVGLFKHVEPLGLSFARFGPRVLQLA